MYLYDYILNRGRLKDSGSSGPVKGVVDYYSDFAAISASDGDIYNVRIGSGGVFALVHYYQYPKGFYIYDGSSWNQCKFQSQISEDAITLVNVNDWTGLVASGASVNTDDRIIYNGVEYKNLTGSIGTAPDADITNWTATGELEYTVTRGWDELVSVCESGVYSTIKVIGTYKCTDNEANPLVAHANVKLISGESRETTIWDFDGANNTSITDCIKCSSNDLIIENIKFLNVRGYAVTGYDTISPYPIVRYCGLYDSVANSKGFNNCQSLYNKGEITSHSWSGQYFAWGCYPFIGNNFKWFYNGVGYCYQCYGNRAERASTAFNSCNMLNNNYIAATDKAFRACANVGTDNMFIYIYNVEYELCTFINTYMDNTDNTKKLTEDYSLITTGATRVQQHPDKDGIYAMMSDIASDGDGDYIAYKVLFGGL